MKIWLVQILNENMESSAPKMWSLGCAVSKHRAAQDMTQISLHKMPGSREESIWECLLFTYTQGEKKHKEQSGSVLGDRGHRNRGLHRFKTTSGSHLLHYRFYYYYSNFVDVNYLYFMTPPPASIREVSKIFLVKNDIEL